MRRILFATALLVSANSASADPVFRPVTSEPSMTVNTAPKVKVPADAMPFGKPTPAPTATTPAPTPLIAPSVQKPSVSRSGEVIDSVGGDAIPALPIEAVKQNGITYLSGGIGDEEVAQLKAQEGAYNVQLQLTGLSGEYLGGATLAVKDEKGASLVTINDAGPYVYMQLPLGTYEMVVTRMSGTSKTLGVKVVTGRTTKAQIRL